MKPTKINYVKKYNTLVEKYKTYGVVELKNLSSEAISNLYFEAKKSNLEIITLRKKILKNYSPELKKINGGSVLIFSPDFSQLVQFLKEHKIEQNFFYSDKEISDVDYVLPKGVTKVKAGAVLAFFEELGDIKVTKGMVDLLEPITLLRKGKIVGKTPSEILRILRKREKVCKSQVVALKDETKVLEPIVIELLIEEPNKVINKAIDFLSKLAIVSNKTFKYNVNSKVCRLLYTLKNKSL